MYYTDKMYIEIRHCHCPGHIRFTWLQLQVQIQVNAGYSAGELQRLIVVLGKPGVSRVAPVLSVHCRVSVKYMKTWVLVPLQVWDSLARSSTHTMSQKDSNLIRQANDSGVSDPCYVQLFFQMNFAEPIFTGRVRSTELRLGYRVIGHDECMKNTKSTFALFYLIHSLLAFGSSIDAFSLN